MTDDLVQRARQALEAWPGQPITDDDRKVNAVIGSITVAQYDLVRDLLTEVERLRELATEVERLRSEPVELFAAMLNDILAAETERDRLHAAIQRVRKLVDKQIAVSESHTDGDFDTAQIAHVTASLLYRIRAALEAES